MPCGHTRPPALFEASLGHTQLGLELLRATGAGLIRKQLADATGHSAFLSARLAFFDLGQVAVAEGFLDLAQHVALEAEDHALAAAGVDQYSCRWVIVIKA
jgi:hypothetical protein